MKAPSLPAVARKSENDGLPPGRPDDRGLDRDVGDLAALRTPLEGLEVLIPILYLRGVSTCDFKEALVALLGKDAGGLSASILDGFFAHCV